MNTIGAKIAFAMGWLVIAVAAFQSLWYVDTEKPNVSTILVLAVYFLSAFKVSKYFTQFAKMVPDALRAAREN